jgi:hypothetical protein
MNGEEVEATAGISVKAWMGFLLNAVTIMNLEARVIIFRDSSHDDMSCFLKGCDYFRSKKGLSDRLLYSTMSLFS